MTMWRPNAGFGEDVPKPVAVDPQSKRRRSRRRAWRDGLADQTVVQNLEEVRAYRAFERALIGSADPRSVIELELVLRLASLLWRLRRAGAIETGLFELQGELLPARRQGASRARHQPGTPATQANGHSKGPRLERTRRSTGERPRKAVDVPAPDARTMVELPQYGPIFPAPFPS